MARRNAFVSLIVAAVVGLGFWLMRDPVLYSHPLSSRYKLTIRTAPAPSVDQLVLRVTYHFPPAFGTFMIGEQVVSRSNETITFTLIADQENGLQCIHDNNDIGSFCCIMAHLKTCGIRQDVLVDGTGLTRRCGKKDLQSLRRSGSRFLIPFCPVPGKIA